MFKQLLKQIYLLAYIRGKMLTIFRLATLFNSADSLNKVTLHFHDKELNLFTSVANYAKGNFKHVKEISMIS